MKLTPLADNVLLKHMEAEEKTASGIILSTATKEKSVIAEVIAAGPGTRARSAPPSWVRYPALRSSPATRL